MPEASPEGLETVVKFLLGLGATLVLLMPGYVAGAALRGGLPRPTRTEREFVAATIATGLLVHLVALPWTLWLIRHVLDDGLSAHVMAVIAWSSVVLLLGPAILGNRLGALSERTSPPWLVALLRETGLALGVRVHHAWDWAFSNQAATKGQGTFVRVKLKDGNLILGVLGKLSFASADPSCRDLYLQEMWIGDAEGWFQERSPSNVGCWISGEDIRAIEFFEGGSAT